MAKVQVSAMIVYTVEAELSDADFVSQQAVAMLPDVFRWDHRALSHLAPPLGAFVKLEVISNSVEVGEV